MSSSYAVLVVDNEDSLRRVLGEQLEDEGYEVSTASDGDEAIHLVNEKKFDLVLLDINMPRVNGFEVLKFIKHHHPEVKVVMLTGYSDLRNAVESKRLGADGFLGKPYDLMDLFASMQRVLN
jgi:DNA-binding NtrC family response regulator